MIDSAVVLFQERLDERTAPDGVIPD